MDKDVYQEKLLNNNLYFFKIQVVPISDSKSTEVDIVINRYCSFENHKELIRSETISIPVSINELTPQNRTKWFEKHVFIATDFFVNQIEVMLSHQDEALELIVRKDMVDLTLKELQEVEKNLLIFRKRKVKINYKVYFIFSGIEEALLLIQKIQIGFTNTKHPTLSNGNLETISDVENLPLKNKPYVIGFIGDSFNAYFMNSHYTCIHINDVTHLELLKNGFFDLIILQTNARELRSYGFTIYESRKFIATLCYALTKTLSPIYELEPIATDNLYTLKLIPRQNCTIKTSHPINLYEVANFHQNKKKKVRTLCIYIPTATDLHQYPEFLNLVTELIKENFQIILSESFFDHSAMNTLKLVKWSPQVKIYERLNPFQIAALCSSSGYVLLPSYSLRRKEELLNLAAIAIMSGSIPIVYGKQLPTTLGKIIPSKNSSSEITAYIMSHFDIISHEKSWLSLFRNFRKIQSQGVFESVIKSEIEKNDRIKKISLPIAEMICVSKRPHNFQQILNTFKRQSYQHLKLHIIWNINQKETAICHNLSEKNSSSSIRFTIMDETYNIGSCLNYGINTSEASYWFKIDDDDFYGKFYIEDLINFYLVTGTSVAGKPPGLINFSEDKTSVIRPPFFKKNRKFIELKEYISGATLSAINHTHIPYLSNQYRNGCDSKWIELLADKKIKTFASDGFNLIIHRGKPEDHTWKVNAEQLKNSNDKQDFQINKEWAYAE